MMYTSSLSQFHLKSNIYSITSKLTIDLTLNYVKMFEFQNESTKLTCKQSLALNVRPRVLKSPQSRRLLLTLTLKWITFAVKQISGITKKLIWVIKEQNMQTFILRSIIDSCSEINIGETRSISSSSTWSKVCAAKTKQIVNIFGQKLIWREVCSTNSLPSTVLY